MLLVDKGGGRNREARGARTQQLGQSAGSRVYEGTMGITRTVRPFGVTLGTLLLLQSALDIAAVDLGAGAPSAADAPTHVGRLCPLRSTRHLAERTCRDRVFSRVAFCLMCASNAAPPPLQKIGRGKYAHWPIATYSSAKHEITVALAGGRRRDEARVSLKFYDARGDHEGLREAGGGGGGDGDAFGRMQARARIGFILLEKRDDAVCFLGMHVQEQYRQQGIARVMVASWLALCLFANVRAGTGVMDKPVVAHVLQSFGFSSERGVPVRVTNAKRLRDCDIVARTEKGAVRVNTAYEPPREESMKSSVARTFAGQGGRLHIFASQYQIVAALNADWKRPDIIEM
jgi:hypothetical protein